MDAKRLTHTLITPAYKAAWCLEDYLSTVEQQSLRPDEVLVGIDACPETAEKALELRDTYRALNLHFYWFPVHAGCYRIRNTLASLATGDLLHLFDADDLMYTSHLASMTSLVLTGQYALALADVEEEGKPPRQVICHGVAAMLRELFLRFAGFEPWPCGADSELLFRLEAHGVKVVKAGFSTMVVRKHPGSLTRRPDTGMHTAFRQKYVNECARRRRKPVWLDKLQTAYCLEMTTGTDFAPLLEAARKTSPVATAQPGQALTEADLTGQSAVMEMEAVGAGFTLWNFAMLRRCLPLHTGNVDGQFIGWDYQLCRELRKHKHRVHMAPDIRCQHKP